MNAVNRRVPKSTPPRGPGWRMSRVAGTSSTMSRSTTFQRPFSVVIDADRALCGEEESEGPAQTRRWWCRPLLSPFRAVVRAAARVAATLLGESASRRPSRRPSRRRCRRARFVVVRRGGRGRCRVLHRASRSSSRRRPRRDRRALRERPLTTPATEIHRDQRRGSRPRRSAKD